MFRLYNNSVDSELLLRIDNLEKLYELVDAHVLHNFTLFWSIILGILAIIGVALYFIAQNIIEAGLRKRDEKAQAKLNANIKTQNETIEALTEKLRKYEAIAQGERIIDGEKEYLFPPLSPMKEYRTYERFLDNRPVYTKLVPLGYSPASSLKVATITTPDVDTIVRFSATDGTVISGAAAFVEKHGDKIQIAINSDPKVKPSIPSYMKDAPAGETEDNVPQVYAQIWYTKKN